LSDGVFDQRAQTAPAAELSERALRVDADDGRHERHGQRPPVDFVSGAGRGGEIAVAGGVDHEAGADRRSAGLVLDDHTGHPLAVAEAAHHARVQQELGPRVEQQGEKLVLEYLRVDGDQALDGRVVAQVRAFLVGPRLFESQSHLAVDAVVERRHGDHKAAGGKPTEIPVALQEDNLRTTARRAGGSGHAGDAAATDHDVDLVVHRNRASLLGHLVHDASAPFGRDRLCHIAFAAPRHVGVPASFTACFSAAYPGRPR